MNKVPHHKKPRRWYRFSLSTLLVVITVVAGLLGAWKILSYEAPTDRIALYEKAEGTRKSWFDVGPNRVRLAMIGRNDRDGTMQIENGQRHAAPNLKVSDPAAMASAATWLDVVEIRLAPGQERIDMIDARIFDHQKRELISQISPAYGWQVVDRNVVQLYGLGQKLPASLDVWFRLQSYDAADPVVELAPTAGSTCSIGGATFTLQDIRRGSWSYSGKKGANGWSGSFGQQLEDSDTISLILAGRGNDSDTRYQIAAVARSGEIVPTTSNPHFLRVESGGYLWPINFDLELDEVDHFEIRPFGGRHVFFFEAVELPKVSTQPFARPPKIKVDVNGQEIKKKLTAFAPLEVKLATYRGAEFSNMLSDEQRTTLIRPGQPLELDPEKELTIAYWISGLDPKLWRFRYFDKKTGAVLPPNTFGRRSTARGGGTHHCAGYERFRVPLQRIGQIEVSLVAPQPPAPTNVPAAKASRE